MTLKEQIQATIKAYEQACTPDNLNYKYCWDNDLECGICAFSGINKFDELNLLIEKRIRNGYLCTTPTKLCYDDGSHDDVKYKIKCTTILESHQIRLKYLRKLLILL